MLPLSNDTETSKPAIATVSPAVQRTVTGTPV